MKQDGFDANALIDAMLPLLGLVLEPGAREVVKTHLGIAAGHAAKLLSQPMDDHEEPAPVFVA